MIAGAERPGSALVQKPRGAATLAAPLPKPEFARPGDSGAVLVRARDRKACGLMLACARRKGIAFATPLCRIMERLGVRIMGSELQ